MARIHQTYVNHGRDFDIVSRAEGEVLTTLPAGIYRLNYNQLRGWWFAEIDEFFVPKKVYGNTERRSARILNTYHDRLLRGQSTGVLLEGVKGSGKTLLAKKVALDSKLPVIIINSPHTTDDFKEIISNVGKCVVIFDEFEKIYHDEKDQSAVLTLFDGTFANKALSFVIVNDSNRIVGPLKNRPGRLFYAFEYRGLEEEFIREYAYDNLKPIQNSSPMSFELGFKNPVENVTVEERVNSIISVAAMFPDFTFDQLQTVVEEMNRYGETAEEVLEYLNVKIPRPGFFDRYVLRIWRGNVEVTQYQEPRTLIRDNLPGEISEYFFICDGTVDSDGDKKSHQVVLSRKNLVETDIKTRNFIYKSQGGEYKFTYSLDNNWTTSRLV